MAVIAVSDVENVSSMVELADHWQQAVGAWTPPPSAFVQVLNGLYAIGEKEVANEAINAYNKGKPVAVNIIIQQGNNVIQDI